MKVSYSKIKKYRECGRKYWYHYDQGYRDRRVTSALHFGTCLGSTIQKICLLKKSELTEQEIGLIAYDDLQYFQDLFNQVSILGESYDPRNCEWFTYAKGDLSKAQKDPYDPDTHAELAHANLLNLGEKLIEQFKQEVYPKINKVYHIEKEFTCQNSSGDTLYGFSDLICDYNGEKVLFDIKTSMKPYTEKNLQDSDQLDTYDYFERIGKIGYMVFVKDPDYKKNRIQVLIKPTDYEQANQKLLDIDESLGKIRDGVFEKNHESCWAYGQKCPYYDMCKGNGSINPSLYRLEE